MKTSAPTLVNPKWMLSSPASAGKKPYQSWTTPNSEFLKTFLTMPTSSPLYITRLILKVSPKVKPWTLTSTARKSPKKTAKLLRTISSPLVNAQQKSPPFSNALIKKKMVGAASAKTEGVSLTISARTFHWAWRFRTR